MDKSKLAQLGEKLMTGGAQVGERLMTGGAQVGEKLITGGAQVGERLKTGGAQMSRIVSGKMKEILQTPTPESKMVDEATSDTLEEANWGMNLRICAMINSEEFNGSETVKAIKKKISGKSVVSQRLSLDLLEACAMNCEKVFSEVASEKVLEDMVRLIDNPQSDPQNRRRAFQLIRAWGESEDLAYLPVFHQTYMSLNGRIGSLDLEGDNSPPVPYSLGSYVQQEPYHVEGYHIPHTGVPGLDETAFSSNRQSLSIEEKKKHLVVARNSLELLSSILNCDGDPKPLKEDLTLSLLEKCKQSVSVIVAIVESTTNDEEILFEALYLNDELQQVISKYDELEAAQDSKADHGVNADTHKHDAEAAENPFQLESSESEESGQSETDENLQRKPLKMSGFSEVNSTSGIANHSETKIVDNLKGDHTDSICKTNGA